MTEQNVAPSFWQKTLQSFAGKQVRVRLDDGTTDGVVHRGWLEDIKANSATLMPSKTAIAYANLREVTEAGA